MHISLTFHLFFFFCLFLVHSVYGGVKKGDLFVFNFDVFIAVQAYQVCT